MPYTPQEITWEDEEPGGEWPTHVAMIGRFFTIYDLNDYDPDYDEYDNRDLISETNLVPFPFNPSRVYPITLSQYLRPFLEFPNAGD